MLCGNLSVRRTGDVSKLLIKCVIELTPNIGDEIPTKLGRDAGSPDPHFLMGQ